MGWAPDSVEAQLLRAADGGATGFRRNGITNVVEFDAYLARPRDAAFLSYSRISDLRTCFRDIPATDGTPPTRGVTISTLSQAWQRAAAARFDSNHDGFLGETEFSAALSAFEATQVDHADVAPGTVATGPFVLSESRLAIIRAAIADRTSDPTLLESCHGAAGGAYEISRDYYRACYDESLRVPLVVTNLLSSVDVHERPELERIDTFSADPALASLGRPLARPSVYEHSGQDQGHADPFESYSDWRSARRNLFFMSNMMPQYPNMNRQVWRRLEAAVQDLVATRGGTAVVVTGNLWLDEEGHRLPPERIRRIGTDRTAGSRSSFSVAVPTHCFKIVYYTPPNGGAPEMFAYRVENRDDLPTRDAGVSDLLRSSEVTVDELEAQSGIDFFHDLPNVAERRMERELGGYERAVRGAPSSAPPPTGMMRLLLPPPVVSTSGGLTATL